MRIVLYLVLLLSGSLMGQDDYFQQDVSYDIRVRLDDRRHELHGDLTLQYTNNAPHALDSLYFHLWPRAYSSETTAFARQLLRNGSTRFHFADPSLRGTLDSLSFRVADQPAAFRYTDDPDIGVLLLPTPLSSGATVTVTTPFRVKIPRSFSRLGRVGESYQLTQWYPKPAVYDRTGWHPMPYLDQGEFYSEFGYFRVQLTLPENYVVAATGVLQESAERDWLLARADSTARSLAQHSDLPTGYVAEPYPASSAREKTITYTAERVHDFAWFADKRFAVLHDTLHLRDAPATDVWAFFTQTEADLWQHSLTYLKRATRFYSDRVGTYPYPQVTGVQSALSAGAGMEYPMITVIGRSGSAYGLDEVLAHEVGHNWFYGILGSNERDHPWMDEGLNSYYEGRYTQQYYPERSGRMQVIPGREIDLDALGYRFLRRMGRDQAPDTPSDSLSQFNYFMGAYSKPELVLQQLEQRIGRDALDATFQRYYTQWQFRHPQPEDLYAVLGAEGGYLRDAMESTEAGNFNEAAKQQAKGVGGLSLGLVTDQEDGRTQLFVTPLLGFNANDGFMAGGALHNRTLEPKQVEFLAVPLYAFGSKQLAGFAGARYRLTRPLDRIQRLEVSAGVQRFSDFRPTAARLDSLDLVYGYTRTAVKTELYFDHPAVSQRSSSLYTRLINLRQQRPAFTEEGVLLDDPGVITTNFLQLGYRAAVDRTINPVAYDLRLEYRAGDPDLSREVNNLRLDGSLHGSYLYRRGRRIRARLYGGVFLAHTERDRTTSPAYSFSLVDNAASDYRYDDLYLGRNRDGGYGQQLEQRQGGFRAPIAAAFTYGRSNTYLTALNLDADLPIPLPIGVYFDAGMYGSRPTLSSDPTNAFNYVAGLSVNILRDQFHLYVPLLAGGTTRNLLEQRGNLAERLVLRLNLTHLLPWHLIDKLP
ncbi:hypothetical protein LEM8419_00165 [Neolewinella maritima]|uniref:Peptidase M1 membrane alanine aminopeptidase domain-containing protein n=1 Tax=Neolewinella maritima TaxID=1383882 RepID=A0ABN8EZT5_9BACT|nr:M1 family metallopeptidase [Neolewinella maritima]CAH0998850.1 hypothetical protein LEM8419_00165 [Neolewinella maritima]